LFGLLIFLLVIFFNWKLFWKINIRNIRDLLFLGIIFGLVPIFLNLSLELLPASLAIVFLFQFTWMGMLLESVKKKQFPQKNQVVALCLIMVGTIFAAGLSVNSLHLLNGRGVLYGLLAACSYTIVLYGASYVAIDENPLIRSSWVMLGQAAMVFLVFPPSFVWTHSVETDNSIYIYGIVLGLLGTIIPPLLLMKASPYVGTGMTSILGSIELPVVVLGSYLVLGEVVHLWQWLGILFMLVGIIVSEMKWEYSSEG
jgi:drug/metabolite transporter (DMT)-like permease